MKITTVSVDIVNAGVSVTYDDGTSQVVTAPLSPSTQGVSLADLQKMETDAATVLTEIQTAIAADSTQTAAPLDTTVPVDAPVEPTA